MVISAQLPTEFWGSAILTATYIKNRSPTRALTSSTPFEVWYRKSLSFNHFRIFGCLAYVHIHEEQKHGKFDSVAKEAKPSSFRVYPL